MLPTIVSPSELRKNLAAFLAAAASRVILITDKGSNKVIIDEGEYNRLSALADQFMQEDPEGEYRPEFVKKVLSRSRDGETDTSIKSLKELL